MSDSITKLAESHKALAARVDTVSENMNALIKVVDEIIRKQEDSRLEP